MASGASSASSAACLRMVVAQRLSIRNVLANGPARLLQALQECLDARLKFRIVCCCGQEHADPPHPGLLRARCERPSERRALLRGSLLDRIVRHTKGGPKCARGEGRRVFVVTVTYAGGRTRQLSVRERVAEVRRWLDNYRKMKRAIEDICELNHELLSPEPQRRRAGRRHD